MVEVKFVQVSTHASVLVYDNVELIAHLSPNFSLIGLRPVSPPKRAVRTITGSPFIARYASTHSESFIAFGESRMSACHGNHDADIGSLIARLHSYAFALLSLCSSATTSLLVEVRFNVLSIGNTPRALTWGCIQ